MTGYIRNDTTNNIANGNVINANDLDGEFDAIQSAFDASTGHTHDGSVGGGAPIEVLGPAQDVVVTASVIRPKTDNAVDLGTSSLEFKNLYLDGTAQVDTLQVDESATITANLTVNGNTTLGNAATDTVTVTADVASHLIPATDNTYDLGTPTDEWRDLYIDGTANIDSLVADTADINGGTIDGATIATSDITVGSGKTLNVSAGTLTLADNQISGDKVEGGTINAITITTLGSTTGNITTVNSTTVDTTNIEVTNIKAKDGTASATIADTTGVMTVASLVATTADINGGTVDNATIATSDITVGTGKTLNVSAGTLTLADNQISGDKVEGGTINAVTINTLASTTGNITTVNATTVDSTNLEVTTLKAKDGTAAGSIADTTGVVTLASSVLTTTDINGGTIDGATIATSDITVGTGKTIDVSAGTLTLADNQISGDKVEGGTINAITINTLGSTTGNITTVNATTIDSTNLEVTNIKAKDGTASATIADSTGVMTVASAVLTTADINGGTIDGATIGGSSAAAGTFTTATATTGNITTVNATTVDTTNIEVTTLKAKDGTSAGSIADSTGVVTLASSVLTTTDINGGTIDGAVIGGSSAAAGTFTTVTASGDVTIADKIVHSGDTNTAIRFPAADTVTVETSGAERLRVDANGSVGIGTINPGARLDVSGASGGIVYVRGTGDAYQEIAGGGRTPGTGSVLVGQGNSGEGYLWNRLNSFLSFGTNATERMRIDSSGRVGIGNTSPDEVLVVKTSAGNIKSSALNSGAKWVGTNAANNAEAEFGFQGNPLVFLTNGSERMRIDASGNLGLGVTPSAWFSNRKALQINNAGSSIAGFSGGGLTEIRNNSFLNAAGSEIYASTNPAAVYQMNNGTHAWYNAPSGTAGNAITFTQAMTLDASGNLALGTTSATQRLSLAKSISYNTDAALYMDMAVNDGAVDNNATYNWRVGLTGNAGGQSYSFSTLARSQGSYVERVRIDRNGGFSIGTADSFTKLSIGANTSAGTVGATPSIVLTNRDQTNATFVHSGIFAETYRDVAFPHYTAGIWFTRAPQVGNASSSSDIVFGAMNTNSASSLPSERMRLDSSGNLLVGTTAASAKLTVNSNAGGSSYISGATTDFRTGGNTNNPNGRGLVAAFNAGGVGDAANTYGASITIGASSVGVIAIQHKPGAPFAIADFFPGGTYVGDGNPPTERLRVDGSGNLLVGTTSADGYKFGLGNGAQRIFRSTSGAGQTQFINLLSLDNTSNGNGPSLDFSLTGNQGGSAVKAFVQCRVGDASSSNLQGSLVFGTSGGGTGTAATERARIDPDGNLLVGTTTVSGSSRLNVVGGGGAYVQDTNGHVWTTANSTASTANFNLRAAQTKNACIGFTEISVADRWAIGIIGGNSSLVFGSGSSDIGAATERMKIGSDGQKTHSYDSGATTKEIFNWSNNTTGMSFRSASVERGNIYFLDTGVAFNTTSDYRLKEDVQPMTGASERVLALKPVNFAWKVNGSRVDGFLAHEAQAVVPEAVTGAKDDVDDEGNPKYQGIDQSKLVPLLTAALQEALTEIAGLKARITALEA